MKVTKEQKAVITKHLEKLAVMPMDELLQFEQKWHMAKQDLEAPIFYWVVLGCDKVRAHFTKCRNTAIIEHSELREGEI